jgi:hypothetical protein
MSTVTRKPDNNKAQVPQAREAEIEALIHKGLSAPADHVPLPSNDEDRQVVLRLPVSLLSRVDRAVKQRPMKTPRHRWLLEAILEKLERESV